MPNFGAGVGGAATGAAIGSIIPGIGTLAGAGIGFLGGLFGGPKKAKFRPDQFNADPDNLLGQRLNQLQDPNYLRQDFLNTSRQLAPSQSDVLGRLRASGLGSGASSILADQQFRAQQGRATAAGANAFSQFRLQNQGAIQNTLGQIVGNNQFALGQANNRFLGQQQRRDSFTNTFLSAGFGLAGQQLGQGGFGG